MRAHTIDLEKYAKKHVKKNELIWHTDGARCYRHLPKVTQVKHCKKQFVAVKKLDLKDKGTLFCYGGTQLQDGLWHHVKHHIPATANTSLKTIAKYVAAWNWRYRRSQSADLFQELGRSVAAVR